MNVAEICSYACRTTGDISSDAMLYAKDALRLKYQTLYDAHAWRESMRTMDGIAMDPTLNGIFFLPYDSEEIIYLSMGFDGATYIRLTYRERDWIERNLYPYAATPGYMPWYYRAENLAWPRFNPGHLTLTCASKSPFQAFVSGLDQNSVPVSESFIMQGVITGSTVNPTSVTTANSYSSVTTLSKDTHSNWLTISDGTKTLRMPEGLGEFIFTQIVLFPSPFSATPNPVYLRVQVKLKADTLDNDLSVPRISHIWDALICWVTSQMYKRLGQITKYQAEEASSMAHVEAAIQVEKNQSESRQQVTPLIYDRGDYLQYTDWVGPWSGNPFGYSGY